MKCKFCGQTIEEDSKFCGNCGKDPNTEWKFGEGYSGNAHPKTLTPRESVESGKPKDDFKNTIRIMEGVAMVLLLPIIISMIPKDKTANTLAEATNQATKAQVTTAKLPTATTTTTENIEVKRLIAAQEAEKRKKWEDFLRYNEEAKDFKAIDYLTKTSYEIERLFGDKYIDYDDGGSTMSYLHLPFDFTFGSNCISQHAVGFEVPIWVDLNGSHYDAPLTPEIRAGMNLADIENAMNEKYSDKDFTYNSEYDGYDHLHFDYGTDYAIDIAWYEHNTMDQPFSEAKVTWKNWDRQESLSKNNLLGKWHDLECYDHSEVCYMTIGDGTLTIGELEGTWTLIGYSKKTVDDETFTLRADFVESEMRMMISLDSLKNFARVYTPSYAGGYKHGGNLERVN